MSLISVEKGGPVDPDQEQREKVYRLIIIVLVAALIATFVAVVWLVQGKNSTQDDLDDADGKIEAYAAGPDAKAAAEDILGEIISFDYGDMDHEYDWTKYLANEELRADYENNIAPKFRKVILKTKATAKGEIQQSAYNIVDEDNVNVLAFVRQRLTDIDNKDGVIAEQWATLSMIRDGDEWLIEKIDIVSVPPPS